MNNDILQPSYHAFLSSMPEYYNFPSHLEQIPNYSLEPVQLLFLEHHYQIARQINIPLKKSQRICLALEMNISAKSALVGRWFSARTKLDCGEPRMQHKTKEQVKLELP
jgi:hypothetical protein